jgi:hypothetical protein
LLGPVGEPPELHVANHPLSQCRHNASYEISRNPLDVGVKTNAQREALLSAWKITGPWQDKWRYN